MEAQRRRGRQVDAARGEIGLDRRSLCRLADCQMASAASLRLGVVLIRLALDRRAARRFAKASADRSRPTGRAPRSAAITSLLVAAGVAAHQHLVVVRVADREARRAVVMRRAACRPAAAGFPPAEGLGDGFSGHGAPPRLRRRRACRYRSPASASRPATIRPAREKKPVTFAAICRASSRLRSRPRRGCQTSRVRPISSSFQIVVCCVRWFHRRPHGRFSPLRAPGLRSRNPTDDAGP